MAKRNEMEMFLPEEMQSPFEAIKETDAEGREWWNSSRLARLMGYQKYWNFERLIDKVATFLQQEKGLDLKEHIVEIEEMAQLNNGGYRQVKWMMLERNSFVPTNKLESQSDKMFVATNEITNINTNSSVATDEFTQINSLCKSAVLTAKVTKINTTDNSSADGEFVQVPLAQITW